MLREARCLLRSRVIKVVIMGQSGEINSRLEYQVIFVFTLRVCLWTV